MYLPTTNNYFGPKLIWKKFQQRFSYRIVYTLPTTYFLHIPTAKLFSICDVFFAQYVQASRINYKFSDEASKLSQNNTRTLFFSILSKKIMKIVRNNKLYKKKTAHHILLESLCIVSVFRRFLCTLRWSQSVDTQRFKSIETFF